MTKNNIRAKKIRHLKIRRKLKGTTQIPRLSVFRSNKYIWAQLIDDQNATTLASLTDRKLANNNKIQKAKEIGLNLAKLATKKNIKKVVFDRSGYKYHGRIKAIAEGAREGGLIF